MGLYAKIKKQIQASLTSLGTQRIDPVDFGESLIGGPQNKVLENEELRLERECLMIKGSSFSPRIYVLKTAADRIEPITLRSLHVKALCYLYAGATCRQEAIYWLNKYLAKGDLWLPGVMLPIQQDEYFIDPKIYYRAHLLCELGKLYENEYLFQEAFEAYIQQLNFVQVLPWGAIYAANVRVKMNDINAGIKLLGEVLKSYRSQYGKTNDNFNLRINETLIELYAKKDRGYVYRPRKKQEP